MEVRKMDSEEGLQKTIGCVLPTPAFAVGKSISIRSNPGYPRSTVSPKELYF